MVEEIEFGVSALDFPRTALSATGFSRGSFDGADDLLVLRNRIELVLGSSFFDSAEGKECRMKRFAELGGKPRANVIFNFCFEENRICHDFASGIQI